MELVPLKAERVLAENLERARTSKVPQPSESAFARDLGLQQRTYNRIIKCEGSPRCETLDTIARKLRVQPFHLLTPGIDLELAARAATPEARETEAELVKIVRALSPPFRGALLKHAQDQLELDGGGTPKKSAAG